MIYLFCCIGQSNNIISNPDDWVHFSQLFKKTLMLLIKYRKNCVYSYVHLSLKLNLKLENWEQKIEAFWPPPKRQSMPVSSFSLCIFTAFSLCLNVCQTTKQVMSLHLTKRCYQVSKILVDHFSFSCPKGMVYMSINGRYLLGRCT